MTLYATDESGEPICVDCLHGACITMAWECRAEHCRCGCRTATPDTRQAARDQFVEALLKERYGNDARTFRNAQQMDSPTSTDTPDAREIHKPSTVANHSTTPAIHTPSTVVSTDRFGKPDQPKHTDVSSPRTATGGTS